MVWLFVSRTRSTHDRRHTHTHPAAHTHMSFKWFLSHLGAFFVLSRLIIIPRLLRIFSGFCLHMCMCARRFCFLFFNPYERTSLQTNNGNVIFPLHSLPSAMWQILVSLFCAFFFAFDVVEIADNTIGAVVEVEV